MINVTLPAEPSHPPEAQIPQQPIQPTIMSPVDARIAEAILSLVEARGVEKSICPSEAARLLDPAWQTQLTAVRRVAVALAATGQIDILRKGKPVAPADVRGVIRLRLRAPGPQA